MKTILLAYDFDELSDRTFEFAKGLARSLGASITLVHVSEVKVFGPHRATFPAPDVFEQLTASATEALRKMTEASKDVPMTFVIRRGLPWEAIRDEADPTRYDLLVIGSHARHGLAGAFLGSVAERVAHTARIPTLIVPST